MAKPKLDTASDEILLEVLDWINFIVNYEQDAITEAMRKSAKRWAAGAFRRTKEEGKLDKRDEEELAQLRKTTIQLSNVNRRLRLFFAPFVFCELSVRRRCTAKEMTTFEQMLVSSKMLQQCLK